MAVLVIRREAGGPEWSILPVAEIIPAGEVREGGRYLFELRDHDDAARTDLLIDGLPADALRCRNPRTARWRWEPGFHAGVVDLALAGPGGPPTRVELTTDPDRRKLTREDFDAMVRELLRDTAALFAASSFRRGLASRAGGPLPPLARLEFLVSRADEVAETVAAIARRNRKGLRQTEVAVPLHRARGIAGPELLRSFRSGRIRREDVVPTRLPPGLRGMLPAEVRLRSSRPTADIPEHRQIKACLVRWSRWLANVADRLEKAGRRGDGPAASTALARGARRASCRLSAEIASPFMAEVGESRARPGPSALFRRDPTYRRFHRLRQDMELGLSPLFGDFLQMSLARTHDLYELWCFLRLLAAAHREFGTDGDGIDTLFETVSRDGVTLTTGSVSVALGDGRRLSFQRRYREWWREPAREGSVSHVMVPDIVLETPGRAGDGRSVVTVLDAKYRIRSGVTEAIGSAHVYRDALVRDVDGEDAGRLVAGAYLLAPTEPRSAEGFENLPMPDRLFDPGYRARFGIGAFGLRPGMGDAEVRSCLLNIIELGMEGG